MPTSSNRNPSTRPGRPGLVDGVQHELTLVAKVKPGMEAAARQFAQKIVGPGTDEKRMDALRQIGTVHNVRHVLMDNDTRYMLITVFDGDWDAYIADFAASPFFATVFNEGYPVFEGWPDGGMRNPAVVDWFAANTLTSVAFNSSYRDLTVQQIWKNQRLNDAFQAVLDSPEFQAALKDPANAALVATPAFQQLLDEAAG